MRKEGSQTRRRSRLLAGTTGILTSFAVFAAMPPAHAVSFVDPASSLGLTSADLLTTVINIINWALGLLGLIAVIFVLYGGYYWLTSAGNEERVTKAKRIILNAVIGIVIILFAWAIVNFVIKSTNDVGGGPGNGGQCTDGETAECAKCVNGEWISDFESESCTLPDDTFEITSITTSCGDGQTYNTDVFRCSAVSVNFDQSVDTSETQTPSIRQLVETTDSLALKVEQCTDASCATVSQPTVEDDPPSIFNVEPFRIIYAGATPTGTKAEFVAVGRSVSFLHQHALYPANTYFKLTIPKSLKSAATHRNIDACRAPGCTENGSGTAYEWIFSVGEQTDSTPPKPVTSYPIFDQNAAAYPDRNVNRAPILSLGFDEPIAPWTVTDANITITPVESTETNRVDDNGNGGTLGSAIDAAQYHVISTGDGKGLTVGWDNGFQLNAFTWYEISVTNIQDLCSNVMSPAPLSWRFQTNGVGPGIGQVYPADGFTFACPSTEVFVAFNTSMYDIETDSCAVAAGSGGYVTSGTGIPLPRTFSVENDLPPLEERGAGFQYNNYCTKYSWRPTTDQYELATNSRFSPAVTTRYVMDQNGGTLNTAWSFSTAEPGQCANAPYITAVSPPAGESGRCLSVLGGYFDDAPPAGKGPNDSLTFDQPDGRGPYGIPDIQNWSANAIVTDAPDFSLDESELPFSSATQVTVDYGDPIGKLSSAPSAAAQYTYTSSDAYTGPCLYALNPSSGYRNDTFNFHGERFNVHDASQKVSFGGTLICTRTSESQPACWQTDTDGTAAVPRDAAENVNSTVFIENSKGKSNELQFRVNKQPPGAFTITNFAPSCSGNVSCTNTDVTATFSEIVKSETIRSPVFTMYSCGTDPTCAPESLTLVRATPWGTDTNVVHFPPVDGLQPNTWYRAVVQGGSNGVLSIDNKELERLNYDSPDDADTVEDSFSWVFGTTSDAKQCGLANVQCTPADVTVGINRQTTLRSDAFSDPNLCNDTGTQLDATTFAWQWQSSDEAYATVNPEQTNIGDPAQTVLTGVQATAPGAPVAVTTSTQGKSAVCSVTVSATSCVTNADCVNNPNPPYTGPGSCPGSICKNNTCTPVVNSITPEGIVGSWVTVGGCYFGETAGKAWFLQSPGTRDDDRQAAWPDASICPAPDNLWQDNQIIIEVPLNDGKATQDDVTADGKIQVELPDGTFADSPTDFHITNGSPTPDICAVTPTSGQAGVTAVSITGKNFDDPPTGEPGNFYDTHDATFYNNQKVAGNASFWKSTNNLNPITVPVYATTDPDGPEILVTTDKGSGNGYNFSVIPYGCTVCSVDTQCLPGEGGGGVKQGCGKQEGSYRCCANRPEVDPDRITPKNPPATCRNAQIGAGFRSALDAAKSMPMDASTINANTVLLEKRNNDGSYANVPLHDTQFGFPDASSFTLTPDINLGNSVPDPLEKNTTYRVTIKGDPTRDGTPSGVQSASGIGMNGDLSWSFTTQDSDTMCELDHVLVTPSSLTFTNTGTGQSVTAQGYDRDGQLLYPIDNLYDWRWEWSSQDGTVATVSNSDAPQQTVTPGQNGATTITATAQAVTGWTGSRKGTASVTVANCLSPWPNPLPYKDDTGSLATQFSTWYCRDQGTQPPLEAVHETHGDGTPVENDGKDSLIRQFFFEYPIQNSQTHKNDIIGILVYENEQRLSPAAWYEKTFGKKSGPASFKVDGYDAVRDGTSTYVAGTNLANGKLYANVYVLGYNDDAGAEVLKIFNEMLEHFTLNSNSEDFAYTGTDAATALQQVRLDTERYGDLKEYETAILTYQQKTGAAPLLTSGTYLSGMSTSVWPSWTQTFGSELQTYAPEDAVTLTDPVNTLAPPTTACSTKTNQQCVTDGECPNNGTCGAYGPACLPPYDQATCWDEAGKKFQCPADSHIYTYQSQATEQGFDLFAHFDYLGPGTWATTYADNKLNPCSGNSSCACFTFNLHGTQIGYDPNPDHTPPSIPIDLSANPVDATTIDLSWGPSTDDLSGLAYYQLYRGTDTRTVFPIAQISGSSPRTYRDAGLASGTTYFYYVTAVDQAGNESAFSQGVGLTTEGGRNGDENFGN